MILEQVQKSAFSNIFMDLRCRSMFCHRSCAGPGALSWLQGIRLPLLDSMSQCWIIRPACDRVNWKATADRDINCSSICSWSAQYHSWPVTRDINGCFHRLIDLAGWPSDDDSDDTDPDQHTNTPIFRAKVSIAPWTLSIRS